MFMKAEERRREEKRREEKKGKTGKKARLHDDFYSQWMQLKASISNKMATDHTWWLLLEIALLLLLMLSLQVAWLAGCPENCDLCSLFYGSADQSPRLDSPLAIKACIQIELSAFAISRAVNLAQQPKKIHPSPNMAGSLVSSIATRKNALPTHKKHS